jgi:hypothetical protein
MDMNTMIEERLTQCCVHVATVNTDSPDDGAGHQCAPFCAVQAWRPLGRQRISTAVGLPMAAGTTAVGTTVGTTAHGASS